MREFVIVNDVGPRDGLQNQARILTPAQRLELVAALLAAGVKHIEVGSFVSPAAGGGAGRPPPRGSSQACRPTPKPAIAC
jgi:hypothetical protein